MRNPITGRDILKAALASAILTLAILVAVSFVRSQEPWQPDNWHLFVKYTPAKLTQSIATSNGRPSIEMVPRTRLERKYQVPGGLDHATGWRSDLYAWASSRDSGLYRLPVLNTFGFYQYELGHYRTWDKGSMFMDVLTNTRTGKVFEVRIAVKESDRWHRFVDYRNPAQQPPGYHRVKTSECRSCHEGKDAPGTGGYGVAMIPGSDTIFSYPLSALER